MFGSRTPLSRSVAVGVLIMSAAAGASALTVKATNQRIDGVCAAVLIVNEAGRARGPVTTLRGALSLRDEGKDIRMAFIGKGYLASPMTTKRFPLFINS